MSAYAGFLRGLIRLILIVPDLRHCLKLTGWKLQYKNSNNVTDNRSYNTIGITRCYNIEEKGRVKQLTINGSYYQ